MSITEQRAWWCACLIKMIYITLILPAHTPACVLFSTCERERGTINMVKKMYSWTRGRRERERERERERDEHA